MILDCVRSREISTCTLPTLPPIYETGHRLLPRLAKRVRVEARQARREDETQRPTRNLKRLFPNQHLAGHIGPAPEKLKAKYNIDDLPPLSVLHGHEPSTWLGDPTLRRTPGVYMRPSKLAWSASLLDYLCVQFPVKQEREKLRASKGGWK